MVNDIDKKNEDLLNQYHDLLIRMVDSATPIAFKSDGVIIPKDIWIEILKIVR